MAKGFGESQTSPENKGKGTFLGVLFVLLSIGVAGLWIYDERQIPSVDTSLGMTLKGAPDFSLVDEENNRVKLSDFKGRVTMVHFWATWCPPCIDELPKLINFSHKMKDSGLVTLFISLDSSWEVAQRTFSGKSLPKSARSLLDIKSEAASAFGSYEFPETYLLGRDHKIIAKWVGPQKWETDFFKEIIEKVLAKK